jgi:hypothetical protein
MIYKQLKKYLLGSLSPEKMEEIDLKLISGNDFEETLSIAEDKLIDEFLDNELNDAENELFHKQFLVSPDRKLKVEMIQTLKLRARKEGSLTALEKTEKNTPISFFEKLRSSISFVPVQVGFSLLFLGMILVVTFLVFINSGNLSELEENYTKINQEKINLNNQNNFQIELLGGVSRGSNSIKRVQQKEFTDDVVIRIALTSEPEPNHYFKVVLENNQKKIFEINKIKVYQNKQGKEFRFVLPSKVLEKGIIQIKIYKNNSTDSYVNKIFEIL